MSYRLMMIAALLGLLGVAVPASAQELTLKRVMLSSAGLGYYEYEAPVDGDASVKLTVPLNQVDDLLKSLVVYDDKGGVGGLSLPGKEPLQQAFKDLPFNEASLTTPAQLLTSLKGSQVSVGGSRAISGRIVSVQSEPVYVEGRAASQHTRVTLLTDQGLQQFVLEEAESLQFADPALRDKVAKALLAIQSNHAMDSRTLELSTRGQGKRTLRVAYIVSAPVWKASYRLTLPADVAAPKAALQGWATIENMSGQDWKDVELTLVSGRPVAFHQALYQAYYVTRPEVPVEVAGRLIPQVDRGGVEVARSKATVPAPAAPAPSFARDQMAAGKPMSTAEPPAQMANAAEQLEATDNATQVTFKFPRAVTVDNGRTISIPILDRQVPAERIALYQAETAARNPLAAVRLANDGDTGLPPGILTIYERDKAGSVAYVGDARLSAFPTGETRLLPYAVDEKVTIEREPSQNERLANGSIADGALKFSFVVRQTTTYRVRGPAKETRKLIIVQHRLPGWNLVKPDSKANEISEGNYRIPFQLAASADTQTFEVAQEQTQLQELRLIDSTSDQIGVYAQAKEFDAKTREVLSRVLVLQQKAAEAERHLRQLDSERQQIVQEQGRIRENLARVPANSDLQRRYLTSLEKQENDLDEIAKRRTIAQKAVEDAKEALRAFVAQLG